MIRLGNVKEAAAAIKKHIIRTPLIYSPYLSKLFHAKIYLKLENLQKTGSFKVRGATYKVLTSLNKIGATGVVAASAGNHAQGVALAARLAGVPATIVMPEWASITKQEATKGYGGQVVIDGKNIEESLAKAQDLSAQGRIFIHPFDDPDIITGQGTIALEILEDLEHPDLIIVPIGGGGIISGIASVINSMHPATKIIGVQAAVCPSAYESRLHGRIARVASKTSIADGINVKQVGQLTFQIIEKCVDDIVLVEEEQIAAAMLMLLERKKILAEGAGAVPLAALLKGAVALPTDAKVVLLICGGNVDSPLMGRILSQGLLKNGRIMRLWVQLEDTPGSLAKLLELVAKLRANVLHIYHDRNIRNTPIYITHVELELETRGPEHVKAIAQELQLAGYEMQER